MQILCCCVGTAVSDIFKRALYFMQAKRLLAKKKAAAQKKSATSAASLAAAREAKERAKKAKGKKDTSHFNQVPTYSGH